MEKSSSVTPYEPYVGGVPSPNPDYPQVIKTVTGEQTVTLSDGTKTKAVKLNLGKNLWGGFTTYQSDTSGIQFSTNSSGTFTVNGLATADAFSITGSLAASNGVYVTLNPGTYYLSCDYTLPAGVSLQVVSLNIDDVIRDGLGSFTLSETTKVAVRVKVDNGTDLSTGITVYPMLETGSSATDYASYFAPIELCKIGGYQDYIWKDGETWKVHKAVGKVVVDGDTGITLHGTSGGILGVRLPVSEDAQPSGSAISPIKCDHFQSVKFDTYYNNRSYGEIASHNSTAVSNLYITAPNSSVTTVVQFQSWFSTHNTTAYYALATPTDTAVNAIVSARLDNIEKWMIRFGYSAAVIGDIPIIISRTELS